MTMPLLALLLVVALLSLLVIAGRRLGRENSEAHFNPRSAVDALSPPETYRPLDRLFSTKDAAFVANLAHSSGRWQGRLRAARGRVMRLYLRQIQTDFNNLWHLARQIAPHSTDPNFAALVTRQFCTFYFLLAVARLRLVFGWWLPVPVGASGLVSAMQLLRAGVVQTVADLDPATFQAVQS